MEIWNKKHKPIVTTYVQSLKCLWIWRKISYLWQVDICFLLDIACLFMKQQPSLTCFKVFIQYLKFIHCVICVDIANCDGTCLESRGQLLCFFFFLCALIHNVGMSYLRFPAQLPFPLLRNNFLFVPSNEWVQMLDRTCFYKLAKNRTYTCTRTLNMKSIFTSL